MSDVVSGRLPATSAGLQQPLPAVENDRPVANRETPRETSAAELRAGDVTPAGTVAGYGAATVAIGPHSLWRADSLAVLPALADASVDALITDPPYSSGGMVRGDRTQDVHTKYVRSDSIAGESLEGFGGDGRDQRGYGYWCTLWLSECLRIVKPGGVAVLFTDWRQLPITTDILQAGGFVWRGIVPWTKPNARPQAGRFSAQCEYVIWGSRGGMGTDYADACLPGFYEASPPRDRKHIAQKPLSVMRSLVKIAPKGGTVLDPFMGAGTTGVAAALEGRAFIGIEQTGPHFAEACRRVSTAHQGYREDPSQMVLGVEEAS